MDTIHILSARFDNRALIHAHEIYQIITPGPRNPRRAATEAISRGEFPVPTLKINGRRYVRLVDLAALIDGAPPCLLTNTAGTDSKRDPGRPRKISGSAP